MNLDCYLKNNERGTAAKLARLTGIKPQNLSLYASRKKPVPISASVKIEKATNGAVTRKDLRPNDWHEIWPELVEK